MNIAQLFIDQVKNDPDKKAIVAPIGYDDCGRAQVQHLTFRELHHYSSYLAQVFAEKGIKRADRVLVMIRPTLEFSATVWALFKLGAVCVFMDPGMGIKALIKAIKQNAPRGYIGEKELLPLAFLYSEAFSSLEIKISRTPSWWAQTSLQAIGKVFFGTVNLTAHTKSASEFTAAEMSFDETAAILFTSGGTGAPKGVEYTHGIFFHQTKILQSMFQLTSEDKDLPGFPLFSLFTQIMGMTSVIPDMNPSAPATCDPKKIVMSLLTEKITFAAGSPIIWERVAAYAQAQQLTFPYLKSLVMFGAPVPTRLIRLWAQLLPAGDTYTPYGATECLPLTLISGQQLLQLPQRLDQPLLAGTCVGKAVAPMQIKVVRKIDTAAERFIECNPFECGEIYVTGPVRTKKYMDLPAETAQSKILIAGELWHKMGDVGYLDESQNLWFAGRSIHTIKFTPTQETLYSVPIENYFLQRLEEFQRSHMRGIGPLPAVKVALVSHTHLGQTQPALVIEESASHRPILRRKKFTLNKKAAQTHAALLSEIKKWAAARPETHMIEQFYFAQNFPVDGRHNIKIDRKKMGAEISAQLQ